MRGFLVAIVLVSGCGLDRNIESKVTIDHGIYGLLVKGCDASGCQDLPDTGERVTVYAPGGDTAMAAATSDADGVYQIAVPAGDYTLCTSSCTPVSVPQGARVRYDWTSGPGGGTWAKI